MARQSLLKARDRRRKKRRLRAQATRGCPLVRNRATWCMGLCRPINGMGDCGRLAPHALRGRTQLAIERCNSRLGRSEPSED
jgi:hypothetical protein